jgi:hypothetical protein
MNKIKYHIDMLFKKIPDSEQKENIKQEIIDNLEEKVKDLVSEGKDKDDAINKALVEFGDIEDIKNELFGKQEKLKKMRNAGINFRYSLWGSLLIILLVVFVNLYYTPWNIWFVYPTFVVLWWPLTMFFVWSKIKEKYK